MPDRTVIVASRRQALVEVLSDAGYSVVGPVTSASMALILAAQAPAGLALVDEELTGKRSGQELAAVLFETWGVRSVLLGSTTDLEAAPWSATGADAERLQAAVNGGAY